MLEVTLEGRNFLARMLGLPGSIELLHAEGGQVSAIEACKRRNALGRCNIALGSTQHATCWVARAAVEETVGALDRTVARDVLASGLAVATLGLRREGLLSRFASRSLLCDRHLFSGISCQIDADESNELPDRACRSSMPATSAVCTKEKSSSTA